MKTGALSCGIGFLEGFKQGGQELVYLIDDRDFIKAGISAFEKHFPNILFSDDLNDLLEAPPVDVLISSPSCAQVSSLGMKREDRADLHKVKLEDFTFYNTIKLILESTNTFKYIVVEYLPSVLRWLRVSTEGIMQKFTEEEYKFPSKYRVQVAYINTKDYEVCQNRPRLFLFFSLKQLDFFYSPKEWFNLKTIDVVLRELDELRRIQILPDDEYPNHSDKRIKVFSNLEEGEGPYKGPNNTRLKSFRVAPVIASSKTQHIHPWLHRVLTPREVATFQGFPIDFEFGNLGFSNKLDLIGRSVSPVVAKHIAESIQINYNEYTKRMEELNG